jgi:hypothetical protein
MIKRLARLFHFATFAALVMLAACGGESDEAELATLDNEIAANDTDPALTSALEDQILVDRDLVQQSNRNAVRPPETPVQAQYPVGAESAGRSASAPATAGRPGAGLAEEATRCGEDRLDYDAAWVRRLPAAFAVYPGGRVIEAAGKDAADCRLRVVTFTSSEAPGRLRDWYRARAVGAGYSSEQQQRGTDLVLAGTHASGAAYFLILTPLEGGGTDVALIANSG